MPKIIFEVYSKSRRRGKRKGQSDKVRLIIQGAVLASQKEEPAVVFYLNEKWEMETILVYNDREKGTKVSKCLARRRGE